MCIKKVSLPILVMKRIYKKKSAVLSVCHCHCQMRKSNQQTWQTIINGWKSVYKNKYFLWTFYNSLNMAAAFQQQIFALDARFNAYRAPGNPNFSMPTFLIWFVNLFNYLKITHLWQLLNISETLYIRRRSQLLRENAKFKVKSKIRALNIILDSVDSWKYFCYSQIKLLFVLGHWNYKEIH